MAIVQIAPGVFIDTEADTSNFSGEAARVVNSAVAQANTIVAQQAAAQAAQQQQQATAQANALQSLYRRRLRTRRANANAALTSLRILGQGPNKAGRGAQISQKDKKKKKKRTQASLKIGDTGSAPGTGLNIAG